MRAVTVQGYRAGRSVPLGPVPRPRKGRPSMGQWRTHPPYVGPAGGIRQLRGEVRRNSTPQVMRNDWPR
jgi:hypothetical protein